MDEIDKIMLDVVRKEEYRRGYIQGYNDAIDDSKEGDWDEEEYFYTNDEIDETNRIMNEDRD